MDTQKTSLANTGVLEGFQLLGPSLGVLLGGREGQLRTELTVLGLCAWGCS